MNFSFGDVLARAGRITWKYKNLWLAFSPLYAVLQGILLTFMQSAWTLTHLRLTGSQDKAPAISEANA